jgi:hypothetical protein
MSNEQDKQEVFTKAYDDLQCGRIGTSEFFDRAWAAGLASAATSAAAFAEVEKLEAIKLPPHDLPTIGIEEILSSYSDSDCRTDAWESIQAYADNHARRAVMLNATEATNAVGQKPIPLGVSNYVDDEGRRRNSYVTTAASERVKCLHCDATTNVDNVEDVCPGCKDAIAATSAAATPALDEREDLRKALMLAAVNCGHSIDDDMITLHRNPKLEGNALKQLTDRIYAATLSQQDSKDAEDAARYRFIRDVPYSERVFDVMRWQKNAVMDSVIDAALRQQSDKER